MNNNKRRWERKCEIIHDDSRLHKSDNNMATRAEQRLTEIRWKVKSLSMRIFIWLIINLWSLITHWFQSWKSFNDKS